MGDVVKSPLLEVRDLHTYLTTRWGVAKAVNGVSFTVAKGETLGVVGESGSGKTMMALSLMRLLPRPAARTVKGQILLDGEDLMLKSDLEMRRVRGRKISMILQDPHSSLNPAFSVGNQLMEILPAESKRLKAKRAVQALRAVKVADPERRLRDFPHQLSGGMKQRVVGAIALGQAPRILIADEPTTALDVTIQLQYLTLLKEVQAETGLAIIFITHDFGIVAHICDRVAVMYAGRIVEQGPVRVLFSNAAHPYTRALMAAVPKVEEQADRLFSIDGQPPSLYEPPAGCRFHPRCWLHERLGRPENCRRDDPELRAVEQDHTAACHYAEEVLQGDNRDADADTAPGRAVRSFAVERASTPPMTGNSHR